MLLRHARPRPRSTRREPCYPIAAAVAILLLPACRSQHGEVAPRTASPAACRASAKGPESELGLHDARSAPPFYADDPESRLEEPVLMGGIATPYVEDLTDEEARRIEPRIAYCVRASRARQALPRTRLALEAWIGDEGKTSCARVVTQPERADLATCVRVLLESADHFLERTGPIRATWKIGPEPKVNR